MHIVKAERVHTPAQCEISLIFLLKEGFIFAQTDKEKNEKLLYYLNIIYNLLTYHIFI